MDLIAVGEGLGTQLAHRARLEVDVLRGAQGLQDGIKTLPRPREQVAQLMDGDAIVVRGQTLIGSLELLPEAMGLDEPCALLVVIKPGTQGFRIAALRVAGRGRAVACQSSTRSRRWRRSAGRRTLTIHAWSWACLGMDAPLAQKTLQDVVHEQILEGKTGAAKRGFFPALSSQLKFPLVARMPWRGLRR